MNIIKECLKKLPAQRFEAGAQHYDPQDNALMTFAAFSSS